MVEKKRKPLYTTLLKWLQFSSTLFEFYARFYLIPTRDVLCEKDPRLEQDDWVVSYNKCVCAWETPKSLSTLEVQGKLADIQVLLGEVCTGKAITLFR